MPGSTGPSSTAAAGLSDDHQAAWLVECARAGVPPVLNMVGLVLAGGAILRYGTPAQQDQHLRATLGADHVWCQLFSEPGAGSDLGSLATRAEQDGDHFVVNGQKVWCSGGRVSNWGILMARTDPGRAQARRHLLLPLPDGPAGHRGATAAPDDRLGRVRRGVLHRRLTAGRPLLGPLHGGWGVGMSVLTNERGHIGTAVISLERRLAQISSLGSEPPARRRRRASGWRRSSAPGPPTGRSPSVARRARCSSSGSPR